MEMAIGMNLKRGQDYCSHGNPIYIAYLMEIDNVTYRDLSIFNKETEFSIFQHLDFTITAGGKENLLKIFHHPLSNIQSILEVQNVVKFLSEKETIWNPFITNGTIIMIGEYLRNHVPVSKFSNSVFNVIDLIRYKTVQAGDLAFIIFSLNHIADFFKGMNGILESFNNDDAPDLLRLIYANYKIILINDKCKEISEFDFDKEISTRAILQFDYFFRKEFNDKVNNLIDLFYKLDAWHSMAIAVKHYNLHFPVFCNKTKPYFKAEKLFHILLQNPVGNEIQFDHNVNFLFLTGANMAGKSTFIKAIGISVFLAHLGMGVPADNLELSLFDGILSNIRIQDNIIRGESYFYNEVKRIKNTILKVKNGNNWIILIDELFTGTNAQDALICSLTVIKGLSKIRESIFVLSTHLYEIAKDLETQQGIIFKYFESILENGKFRFNFNLKDGVSKDRLGYAILENESIIDLLNKI